MSSRYVIFAERPPPGTPAQIDPTRVFALAASPLPSAVDDGQVVLRAIYLALDPAMRSWMNDARGYVKPLQLGEVMRGVAVAQVVLSRSSRLTRGDYVLAPIGWREHATIEATQCDKLSLPNGVPLRSVHGIIGITALTAYFGLFDVGKPVPGDTVLVSGAAGATGSVVCQLAKLAGARVIGIAGSAEKCHHLVNVLNCDAALNYNDPTFAKSLAKLTPAYIDIFFDNVGGDILDLALGRLAQGARVVLCGGIAHYGSDRPISGPTRYLSLVTQRATMQGFIVTDYQAKFAHARSRLLAWAAAGKLLVTERVVQGNEDGRGLAAAPRALNELFVAGGKGVGGKLLVQVGPESETLARL